MENDVSYSMFILRISCENDKYKARLHRPYKIETNTNNYMQIAFTGVRKATKTKHEGPKVCPTFEVTSTDQAHVFTGALTQRPHLLHARFLFP